MATGDERDEEVLTEGLARWVQSEPELVARVAGARDGVVAERFSVHGVAHAAGGIANETLLVDLGPSTGGIVVRLPPLAPTYPDYDLAPQAEVQNAVAAAGVPAPAPAAMVGDPEWIGCPFLVMPRVDGDVPGPAPLFDPYVRDAGPAVQRAMHDALVDAVADVHGVDWGAYGLAGSLPGISLRRALDRWADYVDWAAEGDPLPALARAMAWCTEHVPVEEGPPVLLWGDVRMGNLVFGPDRTVNAVLDWDLASIGPAEMDLGWHLGLEFMMEVLFGDRPPGFLTRDDVVARYEGRSARAVRDLDWHEVFALVRALAINDRTQRITGDERRRDNPMGAVLLARIEAAEPR